MCLRFEMVEGWCVSSARPPGRCSLLGEGWAERKQTDFDWDRRKRSKLLEGADIWELIETIISSIPPVISLREVCYSKHSCTAQECLELRDPIGMRDFVLAASDENNRIFSTCSPFV